MRYRAHRFNGELPCGFEVKAMPEKGKRKAKKKQRRFYVLPWIDKIAAAIFWVVKTILLLIDWFTR